MLKSTHQPAHAPSRSPLPPGWTEHQAPTGHLYYYNASTKQSTYTRPSITLKEPTHPITSFSGPGNQLFQQLSFQTPAELHPPSQHQSFTPHYRGRQQQQKGPPDDRPKHKQLIPGAAPWLLVRTKLRRRFVHNPDSGESLWKFPPAVMKAVVELDRKERERRERHEKGVHSEDERADGDQEKEDTQAGRTDFDSDEYEEVEVTDDEDDEQGSKRQRTKEEADVPAGPVEFGEDDIAFQLAQMEAMGGDDGHGDDYGYDEPELSEEDSRALFMDLLEDFKISPFTPWDTVVSEGKIIDDDRYTVLPSMRSRREVFDLWSKTKVIELRRLREQQAKQDPRISYVAFLADKATPKLYWPEFRRKYQKEAEMKDRKLSDKDREKLYREHINRLKTSDSDRKRDLRKLLEEVPRKEMNNQTSMDSLGPTLLRDLRYIGLPPKVRDPLIEAFIQMASGPPEQVEDIASEEEELKRIEKADRQGREKALTDRQRAVQE